jgi:hypothetical protein
MNEAEQTRRLRSMNERELVKLQKQLAANVADIQASIARTDHEMTLEYWLEHSKNTPAVLDKYGSAEKACAWWRSYFAGTQNKRRARLMTRTRRLEQVGRRLVDVRAGAPLTNEPAVVDKVAQGIWRRLVADRREMTLYVEASRRAGDERRLAVFQAKVEKMDEQMRAIAEGGAR